MAWGAGGRTIIYTLQALRLIAAASIVAFHALHHAAPRASFHEIGTRKREGASIDGRHPFIPGRLLCGAVSVGQRCLLRIAGIAALLMAVVTTGWTRDIYSWSQNVAIAPFDGSRQQGETAIVTDANG